MRTLRRGDERLRRRRGLRHTWIYFVISLFTSFGFAMALYLAAQEGQVRWLAAQRT